MSAKKMNYSFKTQDSSDTKLPVWMKALSRDSTWDSMDQSAKDKLLHRLTEVLEREQSITVLLNGSPVRITLEAGEIKLERLNPKYGF